MSSPSKKGWQGWQGWQRGNAVPRPLHNEVFFFVIGGLLLIVFSIYSTMSPRLSLGKNQRSPSEMRKPGPRNKDIGVIERAFNSGKYSKREASFYHGEGRDQKGIGLRR